MGEELLSRRDLGDLPESQGAFDEWRRGYNGERPHEALEDRPPSSRYRPSPEPFPEELPPLVYPAQDPVRKVDAFGKVSFRGEPVALRRTEDPDRYLIYFGSHRVRELNLPQEKPSERSPRQE